MNPAVVRLESVNVEAPPSMDFPSYGGRVTHRMVTGLTSINIRVHCDTSRVDELRNVLARVMDMPDQELMLMPANYRHPGGSPFIKVEQPAAELSEDTKRPENFGSW